MPEYTYVCLEGHTKDIEKGMLEEVEVICRCGEKMRRKFTMPHVSWGGLRPSQGELAPVIQDMVDNEDENRDNYIMRKETTK